MDKGSRSIASYSSNIHTELVVHTPDPAHTQVTELRWHHGIEISGADCPPPFEQFSQLQMPSELATAVAELGYQVGRAWDGLAGQTVNVGVGVWV